MKILFQGEIAAACLLSLAAAVQQNTFQRQISAAYLHSSQPHLYNKIIIRDKYLQRVSSAHNLICTTNTSQRQISAASLQPTALSVQQNNSQRQISAACLFSSWPRLYNKILFRDNYLQRVSSAHSLICTTKYVLYRNQYLQLSPYSSAHSPNYTTKYFLRQISAETNTVSAMCLFSRPPLLINKILFQRQIPAACLLSSQSHIYSKILSIEIYNSRKRRFSIPKGVFNVYFI
jgi:hypothetical protein